MVKQGDASSILSESRGATLLIALAILFPILIALAVLFRQSPSVPFLDDYHAILVFATDYQHLPGIETKLLKIATEQHNEYKLGLEHCIVALELELTHHLNFGLLTAIGNLVLLPIAYLLWLTYRVSEGSLADRLLSFLPVSYLFFALAYWQNLDWAMTGLQNTPVILFSLMAIYFLSRNAHPLLTCSAAMLAAFASANGFLLAPVGLLMLLPRRAYAFAVAWCVSFVLPLAAYLYHYTPLAPAAMHRFFYLTRPLFFLGFLGCVVPHRWLAALLGAAMLVVFFLSLRRGFNRTNPAGFYFALWILATGMLAAWVRGAVAFFATTRYSIYSILMLIYCYAFLAGYLRERFPDFRRRRTFYVTAAVMAIAICTVADIAAYQGLQARRRMILSGIEWYRADPKANSPMIDPMVNRVVPQEKGKEQAILTRALEDHVYTLPQKQQIQ